MSQLGSTLLQQTCHLHDEIIIRCQRSQMKPICKPLKDQAREGQSVILELMEHSNLNQLDKAHSYFQQVAQYNSILEGALSVLDLFASLRSINRMLQFRHFEQSILQLAENLPPALELIKRYPRIHSNHQIQRVKHVTNLTRSTRSRTSLSSKTDSFEVNFQLKLELQVDFESDEEEEEGNLCYHHSTSEESDDDNFPISPDSPENLFPLHPDELESILQSAIKLHTINPERAFEKFHSIAEYVPLACSYLGYYIYWGIVTPRDPSLGLEYLHRASRVDCPDAIDHIATHHALQGQHTIAFLYYSQSAQLHCPQACYHLYQCYQYGLGTLVDHDQARIYLDMAIELGYKVVDEPSQEVSFRFDF